MRRGARTFAGAGRGFATGRGGPAMGGTSTWLLKRGATTLAGLSTAAGTWVGYHMYMGRINIGSRHAYDYEWALGPVENYGSATEFWDRLRRQPNGSFPMTRIDGTFLEVGSVARLQFLWEKPNPVLVNAVTDCSVTLDALPGHVFQGRAKHSVHEKGGYLVYRIEGEGPADGTEGFVQQVVNIGFAQFGWGQNMPVTETEVEQACDASEPA